MSASVSIDLADAEKHGYDLRHRQQQAQPPPPQQYAPTPQQYAPTPQQYGADKQRRDACHKRVWRWLRSYIVPTATDDYTRERRLFEPKSRARRVAEAVCRGVFATVIVMVVLMLMVVAWDVATTPDNDLRRARTAQLLQRRDHVRIEPKIILDSGEVVLNVLNPARAVESMNEVAALMSKIRHGATRRAASFSAEHIERGYAPYRYVSPHDLDAEPVEVNVTLEALRVTMRPPSNSALVCEGTIHYSIPYNAIAVYDWGTDKDDDDTALLFNPRIAEYSAEAQERSQVVADQEHCRIADIIMSEVLDEATHTADAVPLSASLEYVTHSGFKKRKRIHQPLVACIAHVLKLSGIATPTFKQ